MMIIVPTRGRPHIVDEMIGIFAQTRTGIAELCFALDDNDPTLDEYLLALHGHPLWVDYVVGPSRNMGEALRGAAMRVLGVKGPDAIGFMGDDHRPRTFAWDARFAAGVQRRHIVYGNDTIQGVNLPTHVVMPAKIVELLHGIAPQVFIHMYLDNYWKALGEGAGCLEYMGDVIIEHMHPIAGKAEWDEGYKRVNDGAIYATDAASYAHYMETGMLDNDIRIIGNWVLSGS
jgi:hypothetical protein